MMPLCPILWINFTKNMQAIFMLAWQRCALLGKKKTPANYRHLALEGVNILTSSTSKHLYLIT